jgi:hypothetical protein
VRRLGALPDNPALAMGLITFTFPSSHHALWAEDVAHELGIGVEVGSAPAESRAKCGLALRVGEGEAERLAGAFESEGIEFERWVSPAG